MSDKAVTDKHQRILIVEDASLIRLYYRDILERAGFEVEEALNGVEALEKLLIAPVDLLLVDINMPKMDGLTFLKTLRAGVPPIASTPALMISTEAAASDLAAARTAGANFYLIKPVQPEILLRYATMLCGPKPAEPPA
jgi:two-component system chemotaxis response regulator CheY